MCAWRGRSCVVLFEERKRNLKMTKSMTISAITLLSLLPLNAAFFYSSQKKVLLSDVQVLTFFKDSKTTGRRSSPRQQLECRTGCNSFFPEEMQCYNRK
jgi:hypothetical protein